MLETIVKGSWMMIPLMLCSVLAIAVLIDRTLAFWANSKIDTRSLRANVLSLMEENRPEDAAVLCSNTPGPVSAVLLSGLQSYAKHKALGARSDELTNVMEKAMDDYSLHAISAVEKRLNMLTAVGTAAPLLGMTGTVTGMIASFGALQGGDQATVANGIAEALITTAAGLIIAVVAMIPHSLFTSLADKVDLEIEESTSELLDFVATRVERDRS
jgi:biopolymer transport protein ExbB